VSEQKLVLMTGPAALTGDARRFAHLTWMLAVTEFKTRFLDSTLGYLWTLIRPLLLFGVLYFVFSEIVRVGAGTPHYPLMLLSGIVIFTFFSETTGDAVASLVEHENLVRKISFPRLVIPISVGLSALINLASNMVVVFLFIAFSGITPQWGWLELPFILALLVALSGGVGMLVSALYVPFRDIRPIWDVALQALFYATPVLYPIEVVTNRVGEGLQRVIMFNPLAVVIQQFRHAIIDPSSPSAAKAIGGAPWLLVPLAILLGLLALGFYVFNRMAPVAAEEL
jgi:ABC-2 type transport system permease protein